MKTIFKLVFFFLTLTACNDSKSYNELGSMNMAMENKDAIQTSLQKTSKTVIVDRKLIKKGRIEFESENLEDTHTTITKAVHKYNAYVAADRSYKNTRRLSNTMGIRIPSKNFDAFLSEISKNIKKFDSKEITISDVTEQFLDTEARLKTKKKLEKRYLEILKTAKKVSEILEVERQIGNLRTEIESIEGGFRYLKSQISFSTLNITFYKTINSETNFSRKIKYGFKNGLNNLVWFFVFLINIWPFLIITIILIFFFRRWRKKRKK